MDFSASNKRKLQLKNFTQLIKYINIFGYSYRVLDVADLVPQMNPGGASRLLKPEFKNALNKLMFSMDDDEFERLWQK